MNRSTAAQIFCLRPPTSNGYLATRSLGREGHDVVVRAEQHPLFVIGLPFLQLSLEQVMQNVD